MPFRSLPEEWLWCESWCANETRSQAQTIDLCNNPRTKEPKLEQARRIGGERWVQIDKSLEAALQTAAPAPTAHVDHRVKEEL